MLDVIEKLLILQDCDRKLRRVEGELAHVEPQRQVFQAKAAAALAELEQVKGRLKQIETDRKHLEIEVEGKKDLIVKYANQQFETRKNEEYRALAHQIDVCKQDIFKIEDQEIALMEAAEAGQRDIARAIQAANETKKLVDDQLAQLKVREENLKKELAGLQAKRQELAGAVGGSERDRYERLMRNKGENVLVGVQHGVCGGCHMRLPPQLMVACQAGKEMVTCSNCGRILYYTPDMDLAVAE